MYRTIVVTGFDPFGGDDTNSSMMCLEALPDRIDDIKIVKLLVPTVYKKCADIAWKKAKEVGADCVLAMGQAGGRKGITPEKRAFNMADSTTADNSGVVLTKEKLFEDGEDEYISTLPVENLVSAAEKIGCDSYLSESAGLFVCNSMLYSLLKFASEDSSKVLCGFVHLPYATVQKKESYSMEVEKMAQCITQMIKTIFREAKLCAE